MSYTYSSSDTQYLRERLVALAAVTGAKEPDGKALDAWVRILSGAVEQWAAFDALSQCEEGHTKMPTPADLIKLARGAMERKNEREETARDQGFTVDRIQPADPVMAEAVTRCLAAIRARKNPPDCWWLIEGCWARLQGRPLAQVKQHFVDEHLARLSEEEREQLIQRVEKWHRYLAKGPHIADYLPPGRASALRKSAEVFG